MSGARDQRVDGRTGRRNLTRLEALEVVERRPGSQDDRGGF